MLGLPFIMSRPCYRNMTQQRVISTIPACITAPAIPLRIKQVEVAPHRLFSRYPDATLPRNIRISSSYQRSLLSARSQRVTATLANDKRGRREEQYKKSAHQ
jgi:hypothetical protein